jgi:hypothetical protein
VDFLLIPGAEFVRNVEVQARLDIPVLHAYMISKKILPSAQGVDVHYTYLVLIAKQEPLYKTTVSNVVGV